MFESRLKGQRSARAAMLPIALLIVALVFVASDARCQPADPPPRSDTITAVSQFLACSGNPYALCYYSGPAAAPTGTKLPVPALPCTLGEGGKIANCTCYAIDDATSVNYVALPSILNPDIRQETEKACGKDGKRCLNMANAKRCAENPDSELCKTAPVCDYLGSVETGAPQTFYPRGTLISTFSFKNAARYPINSTDCSTEPYLRYAGCMTAGCSKPYTKNGQRLVDCACPTFVGPFQFGQQGASLSCDLGGANVWSAANTTMSLSAPGS